MDWKAELRNPWVLGGAALVVGLLVWSHYKSGQAAASDNGGAGANPGNFPLFQSAALPNSLSNQNGGVGANLAGDAGSSIAAALAAALAAGNASSASASSNLGQDNATLLFDTLGAKLIRDNTGSLDGSFSVLNGTTQFHLIAGAIPGTVSGGGGGGPPLGGLPPISGVAGNVAPSNMLQLVAAPAATAPAASVPFTDPGGPGGGDPGVGGVGGSSDPGSVGGSAAGGDAGGDPGGGDAGGGDPGGDPGGGDPGGGGGGDGGAA